LFARSAYTVPEVLVSGYGNLYEGSEFYPYVLPPPSAVKKFPWSQEKKEEENRSQHLQIHHSEELEKKNRNKDVKEGQLKVKQSIFQKINMSYVHLQELP
jgi:hypothetical protein